MWSSKVTPQHRTVWWPKPDFASRWYRNFGLSPPGVFVLLHCWSINRLRSYVSRIFKSCDPDWHDITFINLLPDRKVAPVKMPAPFCHHHIVCPIFGIPIVTEAVCRLRYPLSQTQVFEQFPHPFDTRPRMCQRLVFCLRYALWYLWMSFAIPQNRRPAPENHE